MKGIGLILVGVFLLVGCSTTTTKKNLDENQFTNELPRVHDLASEETDVSPTDDVRVTADEGVVIESDYLGSYEINDQQTGTKVSVVVDGDTRTITSNALPNHETGEFPNTGNPNTITPQEKTWVLPMNPVYTGGATWAREAGVAINGVKFEPETNERVNCESGEVYRVEAVQDMVNLGLDNNNAHVQPTGEYHYHGVSDNLITLADKGEDLVHMGFANDGFLILYSKSGDYKPSFRLKTLERTGESCTYTTQRQTKSIDIAGTAPDGTYVSDWEYVDGLGDLDQCGGREIGGQYVYIASKDYPYIGRCLNGEFTQTGPGGRGQGGPPGNSGGGEQANRLAPPGGGPGGGGRPPRPN